MTGLTPPERMKAFNILELALAVEPCVCNSDPTLPFNITTDTSAEDEETAGGIGGLLLHEHAKRSRS